MPSSLIRTGISALRDRSRGAVAALLAGGSAATGVLDGGDGDDIGAGLGPHGLSSLVHGPAWSPDTLSDVWRLFFYAVAAACLLVLVAITKPTESSFRSYLTELAFRRHLMHIRSSDEPETAAATENSSGNASPSGTGADTPTIAPFRFANHVAITLRTPSLNYRSYFFFALAFSAAPGPPAFLSDPVLARPSKQSSGAPPPEPVISYLGILGHWFVLGPVPASFQWAWRLLHLSRRDKARKKSSILDKPGVMEMRAVLPKDESPPSAVRPSALVPKLLFKSESTKDLTDLLPLHSQSGSLPPSNLGGSSRRGSIVSLVATPPTPPLVADPVFEISSPVLTALKVELSAAQAVLAELQAQLAAHDESVATAQAHLQSTVDELRQRRKEDDAERQDLKSKAKTLEDQKRQAEAARRESEKRLKSAESARDTLLSKMTAARTEIEDLKGNMELSGKHVKIVIEEGALHVKETREAVTNKISELGEMEITVSELETTNDILGKQVREAEDKLKTAEAALEDSRKMAPEEEMMLMAAAYEAAASEGYMHGQRQNKSDSQWASQAAAYMAEAGMPYLDQSYTARPAQTAASGYGHLAHGNSNNSSFRNLNDARHSAGDIAGFEDFGPGNSRSLAALGQAKVTPPARDEPEDQGSPLSVLSPSEFMDNWLPQGLVRSLEGDITPLEGAGSEAEPEDDDDDGLLSTIHDALRTGPPANGGDSGSDSGEDSPRWPNDNAVSGARRVTPTGRFPNVTPPSHPGGSNTTLPGVNALPNSRRWFSTSPSSENVSSGFNLFPSGVANVGSSDSLPLAIGGYESLFAPSASEKRALKWPLLGKARWSGNGNRSISGLDEITANLKESHGAGGSNFGLSPPGNGVLSAEELFNRAPVNENERGNSLEASQGGGSQWLSSRYFEKRTVVVDEEGGVGYDGGAEAEAEGETRRAAPERKPSFRFFSLRKGGGGGGQ
ncbi:hypothetical protein VHUM_01315 [Vanrija humicola]|uniref:Proteophosphoglycan ppg4 n=1 Tax=Vanrija humicola TaxID=5417 RepID=A0A7D8Z574_VANHU|nr:hypothetical protein VHUM_01315 [Vanrija humicola]